LCFIDKANLYMPPLRKLIHMHLEKGISLNDFLEDFPSVSREQAVAVLGIAEKITTSKNIQEIYETAA